MDNQHSQPSICAQYVYHRIRPRLTTPSNHHNVFRHDGVAQRWLHTRAALATPSSGGGGKVGARPKHGPAPRPNTDPATSVPTLIATLNGATSWPKRLSPSTREPRRLEAGHNTKPPTLVTLKQRTTTSSYKFYVKAKLPLLAECDNIQRSTPNGAKSS